MRRIFGAFLVLTAVCSTILAGGVPTVNVDAAGEGRALSPDFYGIFFEEINHAGDGGIYAEMVRNRSFEDARLPEGMTLSDDGKQVVGPNKGWRHPFDSEDPTPGWKLIPIEASAEMTLDGSEPLNENNPTVLKIDVKGLAHNSIASVILENGGYAGIAVRKGEEYRLTFWARGEGIDSLGVVIPKREGNMLAEGKIEGIDGSWKKFELILTASEDYALGRLCFSIRQTGTLRLDDVSLFPVKTWKGRPNGLRADLAEKLAALRPAFLRFPGGCIVEGCTLANAWRPTTTLGPTEKRPSRWMLWNYRSTQGLGLYEYLQMAEDLGAASMLVVNCGMACDFRDGGVVPLDELQPWIDEALSAIEYAVGDATTPFGKLRAEAGHPEPFNLKYVEIGNENWSDKEYRPRYEAFLAALKEKYPNIRYISNIEIGGDPAEIRDDHYYTDPQEMRRLERRYDDESRTGRSVYVGEYAVTKSNGKGSLRGALAEAAFLLGLERNADLVCMTSFAPLFYNVNYHSWPIDLIGYDNARCFAIPSYYVEKVLNDTRGDVVLPTETANVSEDADSLPEITALAHRDTAGGAVILRLVNFADSSRTVRVNISGAEIPAQTGKLTVLTSGSDADENSLETPEKVVPIEKTFDVPGASFDLPLEKFSLTVLRLEGK